MTPKSDAVFIHGLMGTSPWSVIRELAIQPHPLNAPGPTNLKFKCIAPNNNKKRAGIRVESCVMVEERVEKGGFAAETVWLFHNLRAPSQFWLGRTCRSPTCRVYRLSQSPLICFWFTGKRTPRLVQEPMLDTVGWLARS